MRESLVVPKHKLWTPRPVPLLSWRLFDYRPNRWAVEHVHQSPARFGYYCTCRQCGKTVSLSMELHDAMTRREERTNAREGADVGPNEVGVLSFDYEHAKLSIDRYMDALTKAGIPYHVNQNERWLQLDYNKATLHWLSIDNPFSVTGHTWSDFFIDEAQKVPDVVFNKLRPGLNVRAARLKAFGTPDIDPDQTWFEGGFLRGMDELEKDYHSFTLTARQNRWITPEEIRSAYEDMSDAEFRMLYLGEWVDVSGRVFKVDPERFVAPMLREPVRGRNYAMGLDVGSLHDYTVAYIGDLGSKKFVHRLRMNGDYTTIEPKIAALYRLFHCESITMESNGPNKPVIDHLRAENLVIQDMHLGGRNKGELIQNFERLNEHNSITFLKGDEQLQREMRSYKRKVSPSGNIQYSAPTNFFDDSVMAAAYLALKMRSPGTVRSSSYGSWD